MIPRSAITHWNKQVPWEDIANVEQDLIITRALTDIFADEFLSKELAFRCYRRYMDFVVDAPLTYKQFIANMEEKMADPDFTEDTTKLLRPGISFDASSSWELVRETLVERLKK